VDVILNVTAPNLDLSQGVASRALLKKAGSSIQEEVNKNKGSGDVAEGGIVASTGWQLKCKNVFHTTLQNRKRGFRSVCMFLSQKHKTFMLQIVYINLVVLIFGPHLHQDNYLDLNTNDAILKN